jgi:hypothetical protein
MSEYTDEMLKRAGLKKGAKSVIIDSKKTEPNYDGLTKEEYEKLYGPDDRKPIYLPTEKGYRQLEGLGNPQALFTETGVYAIAGSSKKEQDEREKVLAELAMDPEKVADLTSEERRFLEYRGYRRDEDKRGPSGRVTDQLASMFMDGKEPSAFWTGKKPTYKKTR